MIANPGPRAKLLRLIADLEAVEADIISGRNGPNTTLDLQRLADDLRDEIEAEEEAN